MEKINIKLGQQQKIFFTSDTHFGHKNVINFCGRPFRDVKEMNERLIKNWNDRVGVQDMVFHCGDVLWFNSRHETKKIMDRLNGTIYIVLGNHDTRKQFELCDPEKIKILDDTATLYIRKDDEKAIEIFLSHNPQMTWPHRMNGVPNFFGHIHSGPNSKAEHDQDLPLWSLQYDVGVDNNNYAPIELTEALQKVS